jgi:hypothetical protein
MSYHPNGDPYEREPLDAHRNHYDSTPPRHPDGTGYEYSQPASPTPYHDNNSWQHQNAPPPPRHGDNSYSRGGHYQHADDSGYDQNQPLSTTTPGADNFSESAAGGMAGIAYSVADRNARNSGIRAMRSTSQVPPPPSRTQHGNTPYYQGGGGYPYHGYGPYTLLPLLET